MKIVGALIVFCICLSSYSFAYLEPSFRLKALGEDLVGLIPDLYSDIFRNPAYLARIDRPNLGIEYRIDGSRRYLFGFADHFYNLGQVGLFAKGDVSSRRSVRKEEKDDLYYNIYRSYLESNEYRDDTHLAQLSLKYAYAVGQKMGVGFDLNYFEAEGQHFRGQMIQSTETDIDSDLVLRFLSASRQADYRSFNKYFQPAIGIQFLLSDNRELNFRIALRRLNLEFTRNEAEVTTENRLIYDSLGTDTLAREDLRLRNLGYPLQKVTTFGISSDFRTHAAHLPTLSFALNLSVSHLTETAVLVDSAVFDRVPSRYNRTWKGETKRDRFGIEFGVVGESDTLRFSKLFLGLKNRLEFEKGSFPIDSPIPQEKGYHNALYQIILPVGVEVYPVKGWAVRGSAVSSYTFLQQKSSDPIMNSLSTDQTKTTRTIYNLGFGYMLLNKILVEAYVTDVYDVTQLKSWSVSANYAF